ncbi:tRNA lysidine(34) synthetase TilS [Candidatus Hamiltonella defensa]|uniref:tRNA(Ile)-lysidine synthase n=1 Tax=Hamiltonella defensa subsp. Acyrthosiphon pisum (strain 5AT) TaxID=572265 RepID=TILS_HAMD5|nr:tRNA lysidine(34) synthetase TilS [Candidatus Hamiltonella defensa]C4K338.1 RecName: Full=tRNA(Ile)-lysidine synthase; AltName: Full=tRNA(Ile)-2-lysyl-cytidine synthase; AltName: Full=tRNA(Ile)-lysidine synthetase [Candidatus Hamiltonella defensa 5AT (Acyrthosiphon pisum)]ACQ66981.1 putative ATPase of the PP-loop superfamily [Candidatus Hamiltonella defensa 5AT (Acyrthosiphon pisum)]ATW21777.1 tRNA lysidine(34) synthetase TilS [Candidatus Hamiltonella defensa]
MKKMASFSLTTLLKNLGKHHKFLVAFSGGLDSTVLLHGLLSLRDQNHLKLNIRAIHTHEKLIHRPENWSKDADQRLTHCQSQCEQWKVPLEVVKMEVEPRGKGIEAAARTVRYQIFSNALKKDEVLLTGHHQNDQCETVLLALKRGSGPAGLSGMPLAMPLGQSQLLRPQLSFSRHSLQLYALEKGILWMEDEDNQNDRFDRNFLRRHILPLLTARWPHFLESTSRSAALCAEQETLLDELLSEQLCQLQSQEGTLSIQGLAACSEVKRNALLRRWLDSKKVPMPSRDQLARLWKEVALAKSDAQPYLQCGEYQIRRFREHLYLFKSSKKSQPCPALFSIKWPFTPESENKLVLPDHLGELKCTPYRSEGQVIRAPQKNEVISIRFGLTGNIKILGRDRSRHSKKLWQELGIPPWERKRIPLLYFNETLIAAAEVFVTQKGEAKQGEPHCYLEWVKS